MDRGKTVDGRSSLIDDDLFLARSFSAIVRSTKLDEKLCRTNAPLTMIRSKPTIEPRGETRLDPARTPWKVGDACLSPFSQDGLFYRATIVEIRGEKCRVSFDDYGDEEEHQLDQLTDRQIDDEPQGTERQDEPVDEKDPPEILVPPSFGPPSTDDDLSSTLVAWYLAGYHTGFYQALHQDR